MSVGWIALIRVALWFAVAGLLAWAASDLESIMSRGDSGWAAIERGIDLVQDRIERRGR